MPNEKRSLKEKITSNAFFYTLLSIIFGFFVGAIALLVAGYNPLESYAEMFRRIFGTSKTMSYSFIEYSTPYILTGLSVAFSFKTGVFNIGAEGQYVIGAVAAALVGIFVKVPGWLLVPLCVLAALIAGMIWGAVVGFLKVRFGVNEVLSMIMFNWIAYYFSNFIVNLKSVEVGGGKTWTKLIQDEAKITLPAEVRKNFLGMGIELSPKAHAGIFLAIIAVIIIWYIIDKTTLGYRLKAVGFNRNAAEFAGIDANKSIMIALGISGALAALGGACQVLGVTYKVSQFAGQEGYGFNGITVALIGNTAPFGVLLAGFFFGALKFAGTRFGPPSEVVDIMMGCITLFIAISNLLKEVFSSKPKGGAD